MNAVLSATSSEHPKVFKYPKYEYVADRDFHAAEGTLSRHQSTQEHE